MKQYKLIADGVDLDLSDDATGFPLNFSIADVKNPEKRKRNQSKTITLPGTRTNLHFFAAAFMLTMSDITSGNTTALNFDPTERAEAVYYESGTEIFRGVLQLLAVNKIKERYTIEIQLLSEYIDVFQQLGDRSIADLGWSEYNHALNRTNIKDSWDTQVQQNGSPVSNFTGGVPDGFGYLYPLVDWGYSANLNTFTTTDLPLVVYWKEIIEKCFDVAGISISSTFLSTDFFKKICMGWSGGDKVGISAAEKAARASTLEGDLSFSSSTEATSVVLLNPDTATPYQASYFIGVPLVMNDDNLTSTSLTQGSYAAMDSGTGIYTVPKIGTYNINIDGTLDITMDTSTSGSESSTIHEVRVVVKRNGATILNQTQVVPLDGSTSSMAISIDEDVKLWQGDQITFEIKILANVFIHISDASSVPTFDITVADDGTGLDFDVTSVDGAITDGDTVNVARFLPEIKASEFLAAIIKAFNLYVSEPDAQKQVTIEPIEDFYTDTDTFDDWSEKIDHSKVMEILSASTIEGKNYVFKWKPDEDHYNVQYRKQNGIGYGDHVFTVASTYRKGDRVYELPFAQSVPVETVHGLIIPRVIEVEDGVVKPYKGSPRMFVYNGLVSGNWRLEDDSNSASYDDLTTYPQVNHLEDLSNATKDLNFGVPNPVYWTATAYTNDNLFKYHEKFLRELTGRDAKIIRPWVHLNVEDVRRNFGKLVMINGSLFRLNEIINYDNSAGESTQVELLRIIEGDSPVAVEIGEFEQPQVPGGDPSPPVDGGPDEGGQSPGTINGGQDQVNVISPIIKG